MNCSVCKARLGAYEDGELTAHDAALVADHLRLCDDCRVHAGHLAMVESTLVRLVEIEPQADFTLAVMAKIAAMPAPARRPARLWWLVAADVAIWVCIGALTAVGAIRWKSLAAAAGAFAAKAGIALGTFYDVAQHFHLTTYVALGVGIEVAFLTLLLAAGRKYLSRFRATFSGVTS